MSTNLSIIERGALSTVGLACPGCPVCKDFTAGNQLHDSDSERKPFALSYTWAMSAAETCTLADSHVTHSRRATMSTRRLDVVRIMIVMKQGGSCVVCCRGRCVGVVDGVAAPRAAIVS